MRWLHRLQMFLLTLFERKREAVRLNDELAFHLEQQIAENVSLGMSSGRGAQTGDAPVWKSHCAQRGHSLHVERALV